MKTHDSSKFMDWREAKKNALSKTISTRIPVDRIEELKVQANKLDILYQFYIKMIIAEGLKGRTA
ncbi:CopG family antitoxin [Sulfurospirillum deleyianum]|uniref:Uncharacterized protein n=1 Tax=Sulfurospirillum deleyianum (strain ATCC 51133 / DSM 6946 / 5175) TaxID=525898 RepID=D1B0Y4_SULD5|nr:CopG family antitoxin [Sulfurospirillum deleyianum]ACZ11754.1 conserved hypothetical protein [Sulfurospirillum deleyianum DSM 6946]